MISTLVVALTALMASGFLLAYLLNPAWRQRIEQPKHYFQEQLQRYDRQSRDCHEESP
ncbi:MAG: hypothetical protein KJN90_06550 [Gammaproteobacteria bacterium]|nr:hypothetical protein [Gammaproteobacteria bacterium]